MKKILSLLSVVGILSTASSTVVSCNSNTSTKSTVNKETFDGMVNLQIQDAVG